MNAGIQDAFNLAWKLGLVVPKSAHPNLLDSYENERMPIDTRIIRWTDRATRLMLSHGSVAHGLLRRILSNITRFDFAHRIITNAASQIAANYRGSPLVEEHRLASGPRAGDRAPDAVIRSLSDEGSSRLFDLFAATRYTLLLLWPAAFDDRLLEIGGGLLKVYKIADEPSTTGDFLDVNGEVAAHYGIEAAAYVVRPDGYIAFRCSLSDAARLLPPYLERTLGALKTAGGTGRDEDRGSRVA